MDALFTITRQGHAARLLAARRPIAPVYALTDDEGVARQLCLWWGVDSVVENLADDVDTIVSRVVARLRDAGQLATPATIAIVNGTPDLERAEANFVRLRRL